MDIIIKNLCKSYGEKTVLNNLNAVIPAGKITCLMGQSGIGKTTLLNILMGFEKADSGTVENLPRLKSAVFQENRLCESFSAATNIKIAADNISDGIVSQHLSAVGLAGCEGQQVSTLSGGMKRRVALVRAVLAESDILFLDEPFKGLDESTKQLAINYLTQNTAGKTVFMVTHDADEAEKLGANILYL